MVPDDGVEVVGAHRLVGANPPTLIAVVIRAQASVVVDFLVGGARRGAVVAVSADGARRAGLAAATELCCCAQRNACCRPVGGRPGTKGRCRCDGRHWDLGPLLAWALDGSVDALGVLTTLQAGDPVSPGDSGTTMVLPNTARPGSGGVTQHAPDHRAVPAVFAGAGGCAGVRQPASQLGDRGALVGVAAKHLGDQRSLVLDNLIGGAGMVALADVAVNSIKYTARHTLSPSRNTDLQASSGAHLRRLT